MSAFFFLRSERNPPKGRQPGSNLVEQIKINTLCMIIPQMFADLNVLADLIGYYKDFNLVSIFKYFMV